ncbi:MAG: PAS domain-containing sensor histidine kinase [Alphaproteobacteria bacterium]|nr:PAS domain-containing sensor histidine kinase [Alphaproteobacteria bacterium]
MALVSGFNMRRNLGNFLLDAFDGVLGADPAGESERRDAFISANIMAGVCGLGLWLLHFAVIGPVDFSTTLGFLFLWAPLALAVYVQSGGSLEQAESGSALCLGGFVVYAALFSGGLMSPALPWLVIVVIEAAISGRRASMLAAAGLSGLGFLMIAFLSATGYLPVSRLDAGLWGFAYGLSLFATLIVGTLSLRAFQRRHAQQEAAMQANLALYRQLAESSSDLITRHASDGTVLYASPAAEDLMGLHARELEGLSPAMIVHIQDLKPVEQALLRAAHGFGQTVSFRLRRRDGTYVPVEMRAQPAGGNEVVAVTRDVSDARAAAQEMIDARDHAESASRAKSRFLASMSHELRTPLNAIIGFSDMMRNEVFGPLGAPRYAEYAELIRNSGMHLVDLISDLLDMSKIEAGKMTVDARAIELKPMFEECVAMVSGAAEQAGVFIDLDIAPGTPVLMADRRALKQSLINLLSNAVKFTLSEGRVTLSARAEGGNMWIRVADTGVGIPERDLHRIGKPFEQVEGDMQRLHKGTGLGLSLVKAIAELHGGAMEIVSALGDGTTVTLRLPLRPIERAPVEDDQTLVYPEKFRARA